MPKGPYYHCERWENSPHSTNRNIAKRALSLSSIGTAKLSSKKHLYFRDWYLLSAQQTFLQKNLFFRDRYRQLIINATKLSFKSISTDSYCHPIISVINLLSEVSLSIYQVVNAVTPTAITKQLPALAVAVWRIILTSGELHRFTIIHSYIIIYKILREFKGKDIGNKAHTSVHLRIFIRKYRTKDVLHLPWRGRASG